MGDFSAGRALGAGFRLIGREPLAILVWALLYFVVGMLPQMAVMAAIFPDWARLTHAIATSAGQTPPGSLEMFRAQAKMMQLQPVTWLTGIVVQALLLGAIYRAVLMPDERRFFYLRLGGREAWLGFVLLVLFVMIAIAAFVITLPTAIVSGIIAAMARDTPALGLLVLVVVVAAVWLLTWLFLRLSLATPMSFDQRAFRLYKSWDLTRGHAGKMFLVGLALALIFIAAELALIAVGLTLSGGLPSLERLGAWFRDPAFDIKSLAPWAIGGGLGLSLVASLGFALFGGAWAEIYRELAADPGEA